MPASYTRCNGSVSASHCRSSAWGQAAFAEYFGDDKVKWQASDAAHTIASVGQQYASILVDQGAADEFLADGQLQTPKLQQACEQAKQPLTLRYQAGHDHSYYFIQTFINDHIEHHWRMAQLS